MFEQNFHAARSVVDVSRSVAHVQKMFKALWVNLAAILAVILKMRIDWLAGNPRDMKYMSKRVQGYDWRLNL
jgi:hypothetical protein